MNSLRIMICTLFLCICCSCGGTKETDPVTPQVDLKDISLRLESVIVAKQGSSVTIMFNEGKGPLRTDKVVLRPEREDEGDVVCDITSLGATEFQFMLPSRFNYGIYKFCLRRDAQLKGYGSVEFTGSTPGPSPFTPSQGSTLYGLVSCGDKPLSGVVVSDGYEVVTTNKDGYYEMASKKQTEYVFISVPSGYEVESKGVLPVFHKRLIKDAKTLERVDFNVFDAGDQTNHTILYLGDMHMANRTKDKTQFRKFTSEIAAYRKEHASDKVYAITLGDMTWDLYWYSKKYCFEQYLAEYAGVVNDLQIFHCIGNHDHDMNATGDWDTVLKFRNDICPNYYSFNIGKIHYVVLDNIECTNSPASTTDGSGRHYNSALVNDVLQWLQKDLSFVSKSTPVVVAMHAPLYNQSGGNAMSNVSKLTSLLNGYQSTIVTGHTHVCYTVDKSAAIREYNSGAVCAAWWWAGNYYPDYNISTDGSPAGYRITTVKGTEQTSFYKGTAKDENLQFRAYDRNKILFDISMVPAEGKAALVQELTSSASYGNYGVASSENEVIINIWDWNDRWKVEVTENGNALKVDRKTLMDPSFFAAYTLPHLNSGSTSLTWHPSASTHMFVVKASSANSTLEIKVTDDEGRVYTQTMARPLELKIENYK